MKQPVPKNWILKWCLQCYKILSCILVLARPGREGLGYGVLGILQFCK